MIEGDLALPAGGVGSNDALLVAEEVVAQDHEIASIHYHEAMAVRAARDCEGDLSPANDQQRSAVGAS